MQKSTHKHKQIGTNGQSVQLKVMAKMANELQLRNHAVRIQSYNYLLKSDALFNTGT